MGKHHEHEKLNAQTLRDFAADRTAAGEFSICCRRRPCGCYSLVLLIIPDEGEEYAETDLGDLLHVRELARSPLDALAVAYSRAITNDDVLNLLQ